MPTAMPDEPLASRFGKAPGRTTGSSSSLVIGRAEIDGVLVDALQQQRRRPRSCAPRCSAWRRRYRRRYCRNCPGRRPADSARRSPGRGAPARRRSAWSPCGWNLPMTSPTMRAHFLKPALGSSRSIAHGVEDAAVHRLQPVAHVRQRPVHDGRQRIGEIALLQRGLEVDGLNIIATRAASWWNQVFSHEIRVSAALSHWQVHKSTAAGPARW